IVESGVLIGPGCRIGPHVCIASGVILGARNVIHAGCVIGDTPQDLKHKGQPSQVVIGDDNTFREHVTIHRSAVPGGVTRVGSGNYLMASSHVGHDAILGDKVILANGALLAGHAVVGDRAFISGNCLVHQFTRVGTLALMQGGSAISKDLPPFTIARGANQICGLNIVGLRRAGMLPEERLELKRLYRLLFRRTGGWSEAIAEAGALCVRPPSQALIAFLVQSKRGVCSDISQFKSPDQAMDGAG
ncbi:MAG: acyl-ACP--UDP-N-acetylglucosamine O-acyltransferase, partial [Verrucomicrobia bacterium]|nr:acyl-ACP--UDP-N-acetylglucosamine O-acyltransferase [Verrucomicrobiota bacterium]